MPSSYVEPPVRPLIREQMSFLAVINFILRNLGLMLILGALLSGFLLFRVVRAPETFSSNSIFSIGDFGGGARVMAVLGGGSSISSAGATYITEIMTQPVILEPLARKQYDFPDGRITALENYGGKLPPDRALESAMSAVGSKLHADISTTTGWILLGTTGETAKLAEQYNYAVLAQLDSFQAERRRKQSVEDRKFAEDRLAEIGARLRLAEDRFQAFKENNKDLSPPGVSREYARLADSVQNQRSLYGAILSSYDRERIDSERETRLITLIAKPSVPHDPDRRPYVRTLILGLFAGAFLGAILGIILEYFRRVQGEATPESAEYAKLRDKWLGWILRPLRGRGQRTA